MRAPRTSPRGPRSPDALANALRNLSVNASPSPRPTPTKPTHAAFPATPTGTPIHCEACSICLSPVRGRRGSHTPSSSASPGCGGGCEVFQAPCCGQYFHKACLKRYKQSTAYSGGSSCPLCRSELTTGLTPARTAGGFVSAGAVHTAMLRRVSAARLAVQRSMAARAATAEAPAAAAAASEPSAVTVAPSGGGSPSLFSPGAAYQDAVQQQRQQPPAP